MARNSQGAPSPKSLVLFNTYHTPCLAPCPVPNSSPYISAIVACHISLHCPLPALGLAPPLRIFH